METNMYSNEGIQKFRSEYLNRLVRELSAAESSSRMHEETMQLAQKNYAGDMLLKVRMEGKRQFETRINQILLNIDTLLAQERERLETQKRNEITGTNEKEIDIITRLEAIADIISQEELQIMADTYKDSSLVQRKLYKVAEQRRFGIDTYPGYDKKIETISEAAAGIKGFIHSRDFGLAPAVYIKMQLGEADDILSPVKKEVDEA